MKNLVVTVVVVSVALLFLSGASPVYAQGFSSILDKLDKLEVRLDGLEKQVTNAPKSNTDVSGIKSHLNKLDNQLSELQSSQDITFIENSIAELAIQVRDLENGMTPGTGLEEEPGMDSQMMASLRELTQELRSTIDDVSQMSENQGDSESEESYDPGSLEILGFFDILYILPEDEGEDNGFALGQLEVDIESSVSPFISASGALAYGDGVMEVGAAFIDLHWMGESMSHPVHSEFVDHSGVLVGQFDVPFGADYERLASPDRALFTPPLAVEMTIDGWNDLGLIMYGGHEKWEAQGFVVNGDQGNIAYGGRLSATFSEYLNIGGSYATIIDDNSDPQVNFMGGDLSVNYEFFEVIAEYLVKQDSVGSNQWDITGYYVEGKVGLADWFKKDVYLIGGYSEVQTKGPENSGVDEKLDRITIGAGINIIENASIRIEHLINGGDDITEQNMTIGQFVVSF